MRKGMMITIICVILLTLSGCQTSKLELYRDTTMTVGFNTPFSLMIYTESQEDFDKHFENMQEEVRHYNALFDIYNDYDVNGIKTINDNAGIKPVEVDPLIIELLEDAIYWSDKTDDLFDPTMGAVLKIWHDAREKGMALNNEGQYPPAPNMKDLEAASEFVGWQYIEIDKEKNTVYINDERVSLDVGAIAKGWAVEKAAQTLEKNGVEHGIVNGGGNIRLIGSKSNEGAWAVGITNPDSIQDEAIMTLNFEESMSVVTSGDYERFYIDDQGNQQHHLVNPRTLLPTRMVRSVTITTKDSGVADAISTAFAMITLEESEQLEKDLGLEDLGLVFIKTEKDTSNHSYHYEERDGKHVYYNDQIKNHLKK